MTDTNSVVGMASEFEVSDNLVHQKKGSGVRRSFKPFKGFELLQSSETGQKLSKLLIETRFWKLVSIAFQSAFKARSRDFYFSLIIFEIP